MIKFYEQNPNFSSYIIDENHFDNYLYLKNTFSISNSHFVCQKRKVLLANLRIYKCLRNIKIYSLMGNRFKSCFRSMKNITLFLGCLPNVSLLRGRWNVRYLILWIRTVLAALLMLWLIIVDNPRYQLLMVRTSHLLELVLVLKCLKIKLLILTIKTRKNHLVTYPKTKT